MDGSDVVAATGELAPRVQPLLDDGEQLQVVIPVSSRPAKAVVAAALPVWPFLFPTSRETFLLVATDRRWLVLESSKRRWRGELTRRAQARRDIRVRTSWFVRFDGFDQPYAIDPIYELWVRLADDALDAGEAGRPWQLETAAATLTDADNPASVRALEQAVMSVGRYVPRGRRGR